MRTFFLTVAGLLALAAPAVAQPTQKLYSLHTSGTITANGGSVEMSNTGGLGSLRVQSTGTYTGTWEVQCSAAPTGTTPVYDTDDEVNLNLEGASSAAVQSVTDAVAEWTANIAGCTSVRAIATSSMTGTLTIYLSATTTGGASGGGGGGGTAGTVDPTTPASWGVYPEDSGHVNLDKLVATAWVRCNTPAATSGSDADYTIPCVNSTGQPYADTELPAVETPADDLTNATAAPRVLALMMCYDGTTWDRCQTTRDPCDGSAKTVIPINISTATTTELTPSLAGASNYYYVCSINIGPVQAAQNIAIVDDDSDGCGSVTAGMAGGTTAASGWNIAANGGLVLGTGQATVMKTNGTNRVICAVTSAATQTSGVMTVVAAP